MDSTFTAGANGEVDSIAVDRDRKIIIGGKFTSVNGASRSRIAHLL